MGKFLQGDIIPSHTSNEGILVDFNYVLHVMPIPILYCIQFRWIKIQRIIGRMSFIQVRRTAGHVTYWFLMHVYLY